MLSKQSIITWPNAGASRYSIPNMPKAWIRTPKPVKRIGKKYSNFFIEN
jgi:hypothetical protein